MSDLGEVYCGSQCGILSQFGVLVTASIRTRGAGYCSAWLPPFVYTQALRKVLRTVGCVFPTYLTSARKPPKACPEAHLQGILCPVKFIICINHQKFGKGLGDRKKILRQEKHFHHNGCLNKTQAATLIYTVHQKGEESRQRWTGC